MAPLLCAHSTHSWEECFAPSVMEGGLTHPSEVLLSDVDSTLSPLILTPTTPPHPCAFFPLYVFLSLSLLSQCHDMLSHLSGLLIGPPLGLDGCLCTLSLTHSIFYHTQMHTHPLSLIPPPTLTIPHTLPSHTHTPPPSGSCIVNTDYSMCALSKCSNAFHVRDGGVGFVTVQMKGVVTPMGCHIL